MAIGGTVPIEANLGGVLGSGTPRPGSILSSYPIMTNKFMKWVDRNSDYTDTMARMYVDVSPREYDAFINSMQDAATQDLLRALARTGTDSGGKGYIDFLLQNAQHALNENAQITETLSDNYVAYFFGQAPPMFTYSGILMNTFQDDWTMRMLRMYRDVTRGSQLARHRKTVTMSYDSMQVTGAILNFQWGNSADIQMACSFTFNLLVKSIRIVLGGLQGASTPLSLGYTNAPSTTSATAVTETKTTVMGDSGAVPAGSFLDEPYNSAETLSAIQDASILAGNAPLRPYETSTGTPTTAAALPQTSVSATPATRS